MTVNSKTPDYILNKLINRKFGEEYSEKKRTQKKFIMRPKFMNGQVSISFFPWKLTPSQDLKKYFDDKSRRLEVSKTSNMTDFDSMFIGRISTIERRRFG